MRITVGIATWNRAAHLDRTLTQFQMLRIPPGVDWELLVVDNNSSDQTQEVLRRHAARLPLRGLFEGRQGKSHACNRLVQEASGELILWTDDDVLAAPDWLMQYVSAAAAHPEATHFGGTIEPLFECPPPAWVLASLPLLEGPFALAERGEQVRPLAPQEFPYGANMAIRKHVLLQQPFDGRLGPTGGKLLRGEDVRLIEKLQAAGQTGMWVGPAKVKHLVPAARMTRQYIWQWFYTGGETTAQEKPFPGVRVWGMPRWVLRQYLSHMLAWWLCWPVSRRRRVDWWRSWAFEAGVLAESRRASRNVAHDAGALSGEGVL